MQKIALLLLAALLLAGCTPSGEPSPGELTDVTTPTPAQTQRPLSEPAPTVEPTASVPEATPEPVMLKSRVGTLNCRSTPTSKDSSNIVDQLGFEEGGEFLKTEGEFTLLRLADGKEVYCFSEYLVDADTALYAYLKTEKGQKTDLVTGEPVFEKDGVTPVMVKNELVDLRLYLPDAVYEMLFATEKNITGAPLYPRAVPLIQKDTAQKLMKAFDRFKADGYTMKIYDAYRPRSVQRILFNIVQNKHWIANPDTTASNHNRGCAVDMALIDDATGLELAFPTPMHTFTVESARTSETWSAEAKANVEYMTNIMVECGFNYIESEWWHFSDTDSKAFMTTDINLGSVTMLPKQED